jgi:tetratricopeptide (TPR) repeat protein
MGDAILAVFGVPAAHEDDPERAVRAALEMQAVMADINREAAKADRPQLFVRIGIEAGQVVAHLERAADLPDRMLTGDAVNTASRLQAAAEPGRIVVGPTVYAATRSVVEYRELPPIELKGKSQAVPAWEAERVMARPGERVRLGLEARLVGRDEELISLNQVVYHARHEGRPALVTVAGSAGVGKSRLTLELEAYVAGLPDHVTWLKGRCLAYGNMPYSGLAEAARAFCGLHADDPSDAAKTKVAGAVSAVMGDTALGAHLGVLCGLHPDVPLSREDLFDAWRRILERVAAPSELVLVIEDLHWGDEALLDFLDYLADWAQGPMVILTLARPELQETRPTWGAGKRNYTAMWLDALTQDESAAMLDDLLTSGMPTSLKQLVLERAEGNPLFTEEIVRALIDRGVLRPIKGATWELAADVDEVDLPDTVHALIASRLDRLPSDEKTLLQDASVVGRFFWSGAVGAVGAHESLREVLGRLRVKELIVPREPSQLAGESEFGFRHVLIRDVAYASLPKAARAAKHRRVADWTMERAGERRLEVAPIVATHLEAAEAYLTELGDDSANVTQARSDALEWALRAGQRSDDLWDGQAGARWRRLAAELTERLDRSPQERAEAWRRLADAAMSIRPMSEVFEALQRARDLLSEAGDAEGVARMEAGMAIASLQLGRRDEAAALEAGALSVLEKAPPTRDVLAALWHLATLRFIGGRGGDAEPLARRVMESTEPGDPLYERARWGIGTIMIATGRAAEGVQHVRAGREWALSARDIEIVLRSTAVLAGFARVGDPAPDLEAVRRDLQESISLGRASGWVETTSWITGELARTELMAGNLRDAIALFEECEGGAAATDSVLFGSLNMRQRALAIAMTGDIDRAAEVNAEAEALHAGRDTSSLQLATLVEALVARAWSGDAAWRERLVKGVTRPEEGTREPLGSAVVVSEAIRALCLGGLVDDAEALRSRIGEFVEGFPGVVPYGRWANALFVTDPAERAGALEQTAAAFGARGQRIEQGRCLLDAANALAEAGGDAADLRDRGCALFEACGAGLYLAELEARPAPPVEGARSP